MGRLRDKIILITGAAQGTGEATARLAVSEGARVAIADIQSEKATAVAKSLGDSALGCELDVTSEESWQAAVGAAIADFGRLDGLVNNAGILYMGPIETTPLDVMERVINVNQIGPMLGTKSVIGALREAGGGSIVNVASIEALAGMNSVSAYTSTKWALRGFTKSAAIELGQDGIRVNCVCPSGGNPDISNPFLDQVDVKRYLEHRPPPILYDGEHPLQVTMEDIAAVIVFLLSGDSRGCTGGEFAVDAGWTAGHKCPGLPGF